MKNIITIFLKEIKDIMRDKRTLMVMLLIPLVVYPAIFVGITKYMTAQSEKAGAQTLRIALITNGNESNFKSYIANIPNTKISSVADTTLAKDLILSDSVDVAYYFPAGYDSALAKLEGTGFQYFYTSTNNEFEVGIVQNINAGYKQQLVKQKLAEIKVSETVLEPAKSIERNLASSREQLGSIVGGIIPYFFIIFCMIGCMYPAIDLAAGEKERGPGRGEVAHDRLELSHAIRVHFAVLVAAGVDAIAHRGDATAKRQREAARIGEVGRGRVIRAVGVGLDGQGVDGFGADRGGHGMNLTRVS